VNTAILIPDRTEDQTNHRLPDCQDKIPKKASRRRQRRGIDVAPSRVMLKTLFHDHSGYLCAVLLLLYCAQALSQPPGNFWKHLRIRDESIHFQEELSHFYQNRKEHPAWIINGSFTMQGNTLIRILRDSDQHGLRPDDYHLQIINTMLQSLHNLDESETFQLDALLSDAFITYASHLVYGRITPETLGAEWKIEHKKVDFAGLLRDALSKNAIEKTLERLQPSHPGYNELRQELARYRRIAQTGGWQVIPSGPTIQKGTTGARVDLLRERLVDSGDLVLDNPSVYQSFEDLLEEDIRRFQQNHGLKSDGIVGRDTLAELNVPVEKRIDQIMVNLERFRSLPDNLGERYIALNIPDFELKVIEDQHIVMTIRAIVGRQDWCTPAFLSSEITHVVLNPYWYVPAIIANKEILPMIIKYPSYLKKNRIKVIPQKDGSYKLRQEPGPLNALGRIKFVFQNDCGCYLHDTPAKDLFDKFDRAFSHGCVRIEKPLDLAEYLLREDPKWTRDQLAIMIDKGGNPKTIWLPEPVPIYFLYFTAWVEDDGVVNFRKDVYGQDEVLKKRLNMDSSTVTLKLNRQQEAEYGE